MLLLVLTTPYSLTTLYNHANVETYKWQNKDTKLQHNIPMPKLQAHQLSIYLIANDVSPQPVSRQDWLRAVAVHGRFLRGCVST